MDGAITCITATSIAGAVARSRGRTLRMTLSVRCTDRLPGVPARRTPPPVRESREVLSRAVASDGSDDLVDANAEIVVEHKDLAAGHAAIVHKDVDGVTRELVEFDDRSLTQS